VEETLDLGWKILGGIPEEELRRIRRDFIEKYRAAPAAPGAPAEQ
jgi:V/A-type H+-transporting ATPase subunit B